MSPQPSSDENKNVIVVNGNEAKHVNANGHVEPPDTCSINISSIENTVLSEDDDEPTTFSSLSPDSAKRMDSPVPFKAQLYRTIRNAVWVFPLILVFLVPVVCFAPYTMAVQYGQLNPIFPYVSDAGGIFPQAAYFSQLLDVISILMFISSWIRYKMIKYFIHVKMGSSSKMSERKLSRMHILNFAGSITAYGSAFGIIIIGNFRVTEIAAGHFFGAAFAFFGMFVYMCIMSYMTYQLSRCGIESKPYSMSVISITAGASIFFCMTLSAVSVYQAGFTRFFENSFRLKWSKIEDGYTTHIVATAFEWVAINTVSPFFFCIFCRMKQFNDWNKVDF